MTTSDNVILEFLSEHDIAVPPMVLAWNINNISYPTVQRRLPKLETAGLVTRLDDPEGYRRITDLGERYLAGELSDREIERIEDAL